MERDGGEEDMAVRPLNTVAIRRLYKRQPREADTGG